MILAASLSFTPAHAAEQDLGVWSAVLSATELGDGPARFWLDLHARRDGARFLAIVRPGLGLQLTDHASAWVGAGWIPSVPDDGDATHEIRVWEQLIATGDLGSWGTLQSRTRFEQRTLDGGDLGFRVREFVRFGAVPRQEQRASLVVWDEVFLGLNETGWGAVSGLDQNRLFVGAALPVRHGGRVEVGLLQVAVPRDELGLTWIAAMNWFTPASWRRKGSPPGRPAEAADHRAPRAPRAAARSPRASCAPAARCSAARGGTSSP
jgi:hypothetical protein